MFKLKHTIPGHGLTTKQAAAPEGYSCGFTLSTGEKCEEHFRTRNLRDTHKKASNHIKSKVSKEA